MPGQVVENLLHLCKIKKGELVVDPMAGGGTTLDVCKSKGVRCAAFAHVGGKYCSREHYFPAVG
jgi:DNA modification methylase